MEKSISYLREQFQLENRDVKTYSPLTLAYIGDGVYDLIIRTILVSQGNCQTQKLHRRVSALVKAEHQSLMISLIEEMLTDEEYAVYKRGRNAKSYTMAKNATMADYRRATGFEALMGYLYLTDQHDRMVELIKSALTESEKIDADRSPNNVKKMKAKAEKEKLALQNAKQQEESSLEAELQKEDSLDENSMEED